MSKFDRLDLRALSPCCTGTIQQRPGYATENAATECDECGTPLVFRKGTWTIPERNTR